MNNNKNFEWTRTLIEQYLNSNVLKLNEKDNKGNTGFFFVCKNQYYDLVRVMLQNNSITLNSKDANGDTEFVYACLTNVDLAMEMLKSDRIDFNGQNSNKDTGFIIACEYHNHIYPKVIQAILERNDADINLNIQNKFGYTGFMMVCNNQPELVKVMLSNNKIDQTLKNNDGLTGYDIAKKNNQESFEIYEAWLAEQEKNNINTQVQKRSKKPSQHL